MTVAELIEKLKELPQDAVVVCRDTSGEYGKVSYVELEPVKGGAREVVLDS